MDEAINTIPGVLSTRGKGMMDRMSAITLRGIPGQSRTLVMLDGITINSPYGRIGGVRRCFARQP